MHISDMCCSLLSYTVELSRRCQVSDLCKFEMGDNCEVPRTITMRILHTAAIGLVVLTIGTEAATEYQERDFLTRIRRLTKVVTIHDP